MLAVTANWIIILFFAIIIGTSMFKFVGISKETMSKHFEMMLLTGLGVLTAYAEYFSLIYKVGAIALIVLLIITIPLTIWVKKEIVYLVRLIPKVKWYNCLIILAVSAIIIPLTSKTPLHYDTYLYHAQSVRWIEDYGIVKGLGNFHNRFAYNSAIFSLDALFSFKFLINQSMHAIDGLFVAIFMIYSIRTLKVFKSGRVYISDLMRIIFLLYFIDGEVKWVISSLGSDIPALGLMLFIFTEWASLWECKDEEGVGNGNTKKNDTKAAGKISEDTLIRGILCVLAVFALSVKLSVAMTVLLTITVAVSLLKDRKFKTTMIFLAMGTFIILPFLIRNVIISGYLIYPYAGIDLFNVDWKMPASTLDFDRHEIQAWGKGINDAFKYNEPIASWFPNWFDKLSILLKAFIILTPVSIPVVIAQSVLSLKKKDYHFLMYAITITISLVFWFTGSPDPRYGGIFLSLLPVSALGAILYHLTGKVPKKKFAKPLKYILSALYTAELIFILVTLFKVIPAGGKPPLKRSEDYKSYECYETKLDYQAVYIPVKGDQAGYYAFPETNSPKRLEIIELRGDDLKEGFRTKAEYQNASVSTFGEVYDK